MRLARYLSAALLIAVVAGCSDSAAAREDEAYVAAGVAEQRQVVAGSRVEKAHYEAAVDRLRSCLGRHEITIGNDQWDPVRQLGMYLSYRNPRLTDDELSRAVDTCRAAHLDVVEEAFRAARSPKMTVELRNGLTSCLRREGVTVTSDSDNPYTFEESVPEGKKKILSGCLDRTTAALYPNLTIASFP